jgi:hypothetical protein
MAGISSRGLMSAGAIIAVLGVLALAIPVFTTTETKDVAKLGDLKVTKQEETRHVVPPFVGPAALIVGLGLIGAAMATRR